MTQRMSVTSFRRVGHPTSTLPVAVQALGRLKVGTMNQTEARYALHLDQRKYAGEVLWWRFEGIKFRLADNTFYEPDFDVMMANGLIEIHEIKGNRGIFQEDAKVKVKVAAAEYPFKFVLVFPKPRKGGWELEEV